MKKLLSICFLSMLLVLAGFTAKSQVTTNCCFWLENMQPDTVQDISNLGINPGDSALLPGHGNPLVLYNTMSRVDAVNHISVSHGSTNYIIGDRTDWYRVRFDNTCNLPGNTKVSLEWKLYNNGQLLTNADLSDYVDVFIYTKFDQLANTDNVGATPAHNRWLGGRVYADGVCSQIANNCVGGYPGSMVVDETYPYAAYGFSAEGYVNLAHAYHLDFFYLDFFANAETRIGLRWKQVGNYSLVVGLRERTNGTEFSIWSSDAQDGVIGGHQSCCGALLAQDSIHYLVNTNSQKIICERDQYLYGSPQAMYSQTGMYNVLFGTYTCGHWRVDSIDLLDFQTRITPDIVAHDTMICRNESLTVANIESLAPAVHTDAPGLLSYQRYWRKGNTGSFTTTPALPDVTTVGVTTYYVYQVNTYDTIPGVDISCTGYIDTFTVTVLPIIPPILDNTSAQYTYCNEEIDANSIQVIKAKLNNTVINNCAQEIRWFMGTAATGTPVATTFSYTVNLHDIYNNNFNKTVKLTAFSYAPSTGTYSDEGVTVTFQFWATPELAYNPEDTVLAPCPHSSNTLHSNVKVTNTDATTGVGTNVTWSYVWKKNGVNMNTNTANVTITAPGCDQTDTYVVEATATSIHDCKDTIVRTFTVTGYDHDPLTIAWRNSSSANVRISGCDTTAAAWTAPYTMANVSATGTTSIIKVTADHCSNVNQIHYSATVNTTQAPCTTVVTRTYYVTDECGNRSNALTQTVTIVNDQTPLIVGAPDTLLPVRPLNNDCKDNLPARSVLLAALKASHTFNTGCNASVTDSNIHFYMGSTNVVADGNLDIFANTDVVSIEATITDECGNTSARTVVALLFKPAAITIAHGATLTPDYEVCNYDTVTVTFDTLMISNGFSPYQYVWSQDPRPEESGIIYTADPTIINVYALVGGSYYTSSQFIMTVTDKYGCVASDTSNAIHFFPVPTVNIVEDRNNDDYPHAAPYEVCPTFGHYLLEAQATDNLPYSYDHTLTYVWSGEAIDYTSTNSFSFIAVNENICDRIYTATATVTNTMGCITNAQYSIHAIDRNAPVLSVNMPTDTIAINAPNCKIRIPDYRPLYNASTVSDDCWNMDSTVVSQNPAPGSLIGVNTDVVITVTPKCGPAAYDTIKVCFPEPRISTLISASVDSSCYPYSTTLSVTTIDGVAPYTVVWNDTTTANTLDVNPTETANRHNVVVVTDAMGCQATDDIDLVVYHKPVAADVTIRTTPNNYCDDAHANGSITITAANDEIDSIRLNGETEWHALPYTTSDTVFHGSYAYDLHTIHGCESSAIAVANVVRDTVLPAAYLDSVLTVQPYTHNDYCTAPWHGTVDVVYPVDGYTYHVAMHVNVLDDGSLDTCGDETHIYDHTLESDLWFNYLYQGTYYVEVLTNFNCHYVAGPVEILDARTTPPVPSMTITPNTTCGTYNGVVRLNNTDPKYEYTLNGITWRGNNSHRTFDLLPGGSYNLHIYNPVTRCENDTTINVPDSSMAPVYANNEVVAIHRTNCTVPNGQIVITPVAGHTYTVTDTLHHVVIDPANYSTLDAGVYMVTKVDDATACSRDTLVTIEMRKPAFPFTLAITPDLDCNDTIGTGTITVTSATAQYTLVNAAGDTMPSFSNLNNGNYTVYVYNAATQCTYDKDTNVASNFTYPSIVYTSTANFHCDSMKNGAIIGLDTATNVNYTSFTYFVDGVEVGPTITGLDDGTYTVYALTNYHCASTPQTITVLDSAFFPMDFTIVPNSTCVWTLTKPGNGQIRINKPQGTQYQYVFSYLDSTHYGYDVDHFEPIDYTKYTLMDGHYAVTITDTTTGCIQHDTVFVPFIPTPVTIDTVVSTPDYSCKAGLALGTITVTAHSSAASAILSYSIDGGVTYQTENVFTGVAVGDYTVIIRDTVNNCVYDSLPGRFINVPHIPYDLTYDADTTPNQFCYTTLYNGTITINNIVNANPNATTYEYSIDNGATWSTNNAFTGLAAGTYSVLVKDMFTECTYPATAIIRLDNDQAPDVNILGPARICKNADGVLFADVMPRLAADTEFTYLWYNDCPSGVILSTADTCKILTDMVHCCTYTVKVTSVLTGCEAIATLYVCVDSLPVVHFVVNGSAWTTRDPNNFFNCENEPIQIGVVPTGLVSHVWTNGIDTTAAEFTVPAYAIPAHTTKSFCVTVTDSNGCSTTDAINVISKPIFRDTVDIDACASYTYHYFGGGDTTVVAPVSGSAVYEILDTYTAVNGCDSFMVYYITVSANPTLSGVITLDTSYCDGEVILASGDGFTYENATQHGWRIVTAGTTISKANALTAGNPFNINDPVHESMNGMAIYPYCYNGCDTLFRDPMRLTITNVPTLNPSPDAMANDTICAGGVPNVPAYTAANVNWHGTTTGNECKIEYKDITATTWSVWTPGTTLAAGEYAFRFVAKNECSDPAFLTLDTMGVLVVGTVNVAIDNKKQDICQGQPIATINVTTTNALAMTAADVVFTPATSGLTFDPTAMTITGTPVTSTPSVHVDTIYVDITAYTNVVGSPCPSMTIRDTILVHDTIVSSVAPLTQTICLGDTIEPIVHTHNYASLVITKPNGLNLNINTLSGAPTSVGDHLVVYEVLNSKCGNKYDTAHVIVIDTVKLTATNLNQEFCLGDTMKHIDITIENGALSTTTLPAGITLSGNTISGTPIAADTIRFKIKGTSPADCRNKELDVVIIVNDTVKLEVAPLYDTVCLGNPTKDVIVKVEHAEIDFIAPAALGTSASALKDTIHALPTAAGTYNINITASSPATQTIACLAKTATVEIVVNDTVKLELASGSSDYQTLCVGNPMTDIDFTVANATLSLTGNSTGVALSGTTISGTPVSAPDTMRMTVTATSDKNPACDAKSLNVVVIVNDTVKLTAVDPTLLEQTVCRLDTIDTIYFNVANATLAVDGTLPTGITFDPTTNSIAGIPSVMNTTGYTFNMKATSNTVSSCGDKSLTVKIVVNDKPEITGTLTDGKLDVCEGDVFTKPTDPSVANNGLTATTFWWMDTDTADWTVPAVASLDAAPLYYIAYNACGADTLDTIVTVYPLPVPSIASDAYICLDGSATMTETTSYAYQSYSWKDAAGTVVATTKNYTFDASGLGLTADSLFTFTLTVVDSNNCSSVTADNVTTDDYVFAADDVVSIMASDRPRFIFKSATGTETHTITAETTDPKTDYSWMIANPCGIPEGKHVFVTFDIFRNDTLLTDAQIGNYIQPIGTGESQYIITDNYQMLMADGSSVLNLSSKFNYAQSNVTTPASNHFPKGIGPVAVPNSSKYDYFFLHYLTNNQINRTVNQFLIPGEYEIHYNLVMMNNTYNDYAYTYYNLDSTAALTLGGFDFFRCTSYDTLATDVFNINVTGSSTVSSGGFSLITTGTTGINDVESSNASMFVYPNPTNSIVNARINGVTGETSINVVNIAGQVVAKDNVTLDGSEYIYSREVRNLTPGVYFIQVKGENTTLSKKLVISK